MCRALVAEALELGTFLARVRVGGARDMGAAEESITHLDTLQFSDWVCIRTSLLNFALMRVGVLRDTGAAEESVTHNGHAAVFILMGMYSDVTFTQS